MLGAAPHPSASAPLAAQNKEAGGRARGSPVTQWGVCSGQGEALWLPDPPFVSLCGDCVGLALPRESPQCTYWKCKWELLVASEPGVLVTGLAL